MDLLLAYEKIQAKNKGLVFVGDGALRSELEEYVQKKNLRGVRFLGFKKGSSHVSKRVQQKWFLFDAGERVYFCRTSAGHSSSCFASCARAVDLC